ncbi:Thioesterase/thiol ester dehydrase-isomerase [Xylariomycetidae sp. FL2044]|nr:Thioesterase/thiol ester dehydrase-isomerase [Xylariomycetidae sp. FL2044]
MACPTVLETYLALVAIPEYGPDVYTNLHPLTSQNGARSLSGRTLIGQAVAAANATVSPTFQAYSSQSSFLRPADAREDVLYRVQRVSDGRTYATRLVLATQGGNNVYTAIIAFQNNSLLSSGSLKYGPKPPDTGDLAPEDIDVEAASQLKRAKIHSLAPESPLGGGMEMFDWRPVGAEVSEDPSKFIIRGFVRSSPLSTSQCATHLAAFAYLSDDHLLGSALLANPRAVGKGMRNVVLLTSMNHNISFHDPSARVDEWMLAERGTTWGSDGRVLVHQSIWNIKTGLLVMSGSQEALVRLKSDL